MYHQEMNKMKHENLILLIIALIIIIAPLVAYNGLGEDQGYFGGPWFESFWEPPSGEIESLLFAVQAAIGAIIIGYAVGYWKGQKKVE